MWYMIMTMGDQHDEENVYFVLVGDDDDYDNDDYDDKDEYGHH